MSSFTSIGFPLEFEIAQAALFQPFFDGLLRFRTGFCPRSGFSARHWVYLQISAGVALDIWLYAQGPLILASCLNMEYKLFLSTSEGKEPTLCSNTALQIRNLSISQSHSFNWNSLSFRHILSPLQLAFGLLAVTIEVPQQIQDPWQKCLGMNSDAGLQRFAVLRAFLRPGSFFCGGGSWGTETIFLPFLEKSPPLESLVSSGSWPCWWLHTFLCPYTYALNWSTYYSSKGYV